MIPVSNDCHIAMTAFAAALHADNHFAGAGFGLRDLLNRQRTPGTSKNGRFHLIPFCCEARVDASGQYRTSPNTLGNGKAGCQGSQA